MALAIADADDHCVALVALDVLERLDEERLWTLWVEERREIRMVRQKRLELLLDRLTLRDVHGHDSERALGVPADLVDDDLGHAPGLGAVGPAPAPVPHAVRHVDERDALVRRVRRDRREGDERAIPVEVVIRELD